MPPPALQLRSSGALGCVIALVLSGAEQRKRTESCDRGRSADQNRTRAAAGLLTQAEVFHDQHRKTSFTSRSFSWFKVSVNVKGDKARLFSDVSQEQWSRVSFNDCRKKRLQNIYCSQSSDTLLGTHGRLGLSVVNQLVSAVNEFTSF